MDKELSGCTKVHHILEGSKSKGAQSLLPWDRGSGGVGQKWDVRQHSQWHHTGMWDWERAQPGECEEASWWNTWWYRGESEHRTWNWKYCHASPVLISDESAARPLALRHRLEGRSAVQLWLQGHSDIWGPPRMTPAPNQAPIQIRTLSRLAQNTSTEFQKSFSWLLLKHKHEAPGDRGMIHRDHRDDAQKTRGHQIANSNVLRESQKSILFIQSGKIPRTRNNQWTWKSFWKWKYCVSNQKNEGHLGSSVC